MGKWLNFLIISLDGAKLTIRQCVLSDHDGKEIRIEKRKRIIQANA